MVQWTRVIRMFENIKWLFFDIGSTLVDESFVYERRFQTMAEQTGRSYDEVYSYALTAFRQGKKGDKEAAKQFGATVPDWTSEDERLYPDTLYCLDTLSETYKIGIIANQNPGCEDRLKQLGIWSYIDLLIASSEAGVAKPDSRIFKLALKKSGCDSSQTVMIGDRLDNDILPAKKLGMRTIWIKQGFERSISANCGENQADAEVGCLSDLCKIL